MNTRRPRAAARIAEAIDSRAACCAVIGLGFIGSTLMDALIAAGFESHGFDRNPAAATRYRERRGGPAATARRSWSVGDDPVIVERATCVFVAVRTPLGDDGSVELEPLEAAGMLLRDAPAKPRLVLVESTLPPGTTRRFGERWLGAVDDPGVFLVHSPERLSVGHDWNDFRRIPHLVGGIDGESTALAGRVLGALCETVVPVSAPEVSELSKLLENAFLSVGIGLIGEITRIAHALDLSATEVTEAAATKGSGYHAFHPGPGVGGHCLPNDLRMLAEVARSLRNGAPLIDGAVEVTTGMPALVVDRLERLLSRNGLDLRGARILLVGVGFKIDCADTAATPSRSVVRLLRDRGARACYIDSRVRELVVDGTAVERIEPRQLTDAAFDGCLILSGDPALDPADLRRSSRVLLDAGGGRVHPGGIPGVDRL